MNNDLTLQAYDYQLPQENIAQNPAAQRDVSRLLTLDVGSGAISHNVFSDVTKYFRPHDLLVLNDTRVFPARLHGYKDTGGKAELFLLRFPEKTQDKEEVVVPALIKSSRPPKIGSTISIGKKLTATILEYDTGTVMARLNSSSDKDLGQLLEEYGEVPLPPYISRNSGSTVEDRKRYQTIYASEPGAVAAPTAGLHFTDQILEKLQEKGVDIVRVTLHVGYGTFAPVRHEKITEHCIHQEYLRIPRRTVKQIKQTKREGGRVWAVGTTTVRALEFWAQQNQPSFLEGWCDLYIYPGYEFSVVDNLLTNFHLPKSSLLFLVSALCGRETLLGCYDEAISKGYRFYSYGDAMAIIKRP